MSSVSALMGHVHGMPHGMAVWHMPNNSEQNMAHDAHTLEIDTEPSPMRQLETAIGRARYPPQTLQ